MNQSLVACLIDDALASVRADRLEEAAITIARLLLFYPPGHPARPTMISMIRSLRARPRGRSVR